jgi:hypothetical protein
MGELRRHFRDRGLAVRVPRRLKDLSVAVSSAVSAMVQRLGRAPTASELAAALDVDRDDDHGPPSVLLPRIWTQSKPALPASGGGGARVVACNIFSAVSARVTAGAKRSHLLQLPQRAVLLHFSCHVFVAHQTKPHH